MWLPLTLLVLVGIVSADFEHGWKAGHEYTYLVRSRTITGLPKISDNHGGVLIKALLTIQAKDSNRLIGQLTRGQYAHIHKDLPEGWDSEMSDQMLELVDLPHSGKSFEIVLKHGLIRDVVVDRSVPTWEVNLLKSIISQLQVDSQGENVIRTKEMQAPTDDEPFGSFKAMEDSVGGKCEVQYDITPLPGHVLLAEPELVPMPKLKGDGLHIDIMKTKNFDKCVQRMEYHFGITGATKFEPGTNSNGNFLSRTSTSRVIISGNLKSFTIQSSVTTSKIFVSPRFWDDKNGLVASRMNLTLGEMKKIATPLPTVSNPESTGNLVYTFVDPREGRRISRRIETSNEILTSDSVSSVSSSEEATKKDDLNLRSFASSSSDSSSSISSSEENDFWQPKPTLEDVLHIPLLPEFLTEGKKKNEQEDVEDAKQLINEIANDMEDGSDIVTKNTLDKFAGLCNGIRSMNRNQIASLEKDMKFSRNELKSKDKSSATKQNAWAVLRDAVTQAGTGPALLTIKNWIQKGDMGHYEAADVLSRIPKTARVPTAEYVKAFFELATSQEVKDEFIVENAALISLGELIRLSHVDRKTIHNRYPVHTFGRLTSKHDKTVEDKYIPYLAKELKASIEKGKNPRIQTLILALGLTGHPKMLSVMEPYLEGKEKATTFQRTLMVSAVGVLSETNPKLARSVLYKIYLNTMENHELRCTAVFLLMWTNPPLSMLQRMAEFTNIDTNKHVNAAVKSTLESVAQLTNPEWHDLAKKARAATELLTKTDYSYQFSHGLATDVIDEKRNIIHELALNYIGSDDSVIPRALYFGWYSTYGGMKVEPSELLVMISNIKSLCDMVNRKIGDHDKEAVKSMVDKIVKELNIVADEPTTLEGNLYWNSKFIKQFMPFDTETINSVSQDLLNSFLEMKDMKYINMNKLASYDVTLAFPTETGLPFIYTLRVPMIFKLSGSSMVQLNKDLNMKAAASMRLLCAKKVQGRVSFVTPFDRQRVGVGMDVNVVNYLPVKATLEVNIPQGKMELKTWPLKGEENARLVQRNVRPYLFRRDVDSLKAAPESQKHWIVPEDVVTPIPLGEQCMFKVKFTSSLSDNMWDMDLNNIVRMVLDPWTSDNSIYREMEISLNLEDDKEKPLVLTVAWDTLDVGPKNDATEWNLKAQAVEPSSKEANSESRRKEFLQETVKGIKLAKSTVVDIQLQIPGKHRGSSALTLAWSESNAENKGQLLMFWDLDLPAADIKTEICGAAKVDLKPDTILFYDQAIKSSPKGEFDINVQYGEKKCSAGGKINIKGKLTQSKELKERIKNTSLAKKCEEQMKQGNKFLRACQKAADLAVTPDDLLISVDIQSPLLQSLINMGLSAIDNSDLVDMQVDTTRPRNAGKDEIDIKISMSHDLDKAELSIFTPTMDIAVADLDLTALGLDIDDIIDIPEKDLNTDNLVDDDDEPTCMLDKTRVETFDGKNYPLRLGNCWHVVMTTFPKVNPEKPDEKLPIPQNNKISILTRETQDNRKEVKAILGKHEILLLPGSPQVQVKVNGVNTEITKDKVHQERQGDEAVFEIFKVGEQSIELVSEKYDVDLIFDGKRLMIQASERYLGSIRGLCGNFDGDDHNDFTGPKNCILKKPELFTASYALTKDECEGEALTNAKAIQIEDCVPRTWHRASNVINDVESGRKNAEQTNWGYHQSTQEGEKRCTAHRTKIHETDDKICFTTRPVTSCVNSCSATETKTKNYQFHCMEKNDAALSLKKRIEKGANPDLSQKPVSMTHPLTVPVACKA